MGASLGAIGSMAGSMGGGGGGSGGGSGGAINFDSSQYVNSANSILNDFLNKALPYSEQYTDKALQSVNQYSQQAQQQTQQYYNQSQAERAPFKQASYDSLDKYMDTLGVQHYNSAKGGSAALAMALNNQATYNTANDNLMNLNNAIGQSAGGVHGLAPMNADQLQSFFQKYGEGGATAADKYANFNDYLQNSAGYSSLTPNDITQPQPFTYGIGQNGALSSQAGGQQGMPAGAQGGMSNSLSMLSQGLNPNYQAADPAQMQAYMEAQKKFNEKWGLGGNHNNPETMADFKALSAMLPQSSGGSQQQAGYNPQTGGYALSPALQAQIDKARSDQAGSLAAYGNSNIQWGNLAGQVQSWLSGQANQGLPTQQASQMNTAAYPVLQQYYNAMQNYTPQQQLMANEYQQGRYSPATMVDVGL